MPPTKWYVNLVDGSPAHNTFARGRAENHGPWIKLKATRKLGHGKRSSTSRKVDWEMTWDPGDHADFMPPDKLPYLASNDADGQVTASNNKSELRVNEANDKSFKAHAVVPPFGKLEYRVKASKHSGADNVNLDKTYQAWRRLYYTVNYLNNRCKTLFEAIEDRWKAAYAEAFIDLKERSKRSASGGDETESVQTYADPTMKPKHAGNLDRSPFHLRILLVNDIVSMLSKDFDFILTGATNTADLRYDQGTIKIKTNIVHDPVLERGFGLGNLKLTPKTVAVDVPADALTRLDDHRVSINLNHPDLAETKRAIANIDLDVKGTAHRIAPTTRTLSVDVTAEHTEDAPLVVDGNTRLWIRGKSICVENIEDGTVLFNSTGMDMGNIGFSDVRITVEGKISSVRGYPDRNNHNLLSLSVSSSAVSNAIGEGKTARVDIQLKLHPTNLGPGTASAFHVRRFGYTAGRDGPLKFVKKGGGELVAQDIESAFAPTALTNVKIEWDAPTIDLNPHATDTDLVEFNEDASELQVKLGHREAAAAKAAIDGGREVRVKAKVTWRSSIGGYYTHDTNVIVLTCRKVGEDEPVQTTQNRLLQVALHELGHAMGLVRSDETGSDGQARNNDRYYTDEYGGQGNHCHHNAHLEPHTRTSSGQVYVPDNHATACTMFHTVKYLDQMNGKFCDRCKEQLLRATVRLPR